MSDTLKLNGTKENFTNLLNITDTANDTNKSAEIDEAAKVGAVVPEPSNVTVPEMKVVANVTDGAAIKPLEAKKEPCPFNTSKNATQAEVPKVYATGKVVETKDKK